MSHLKRLKQALKNRKSGKHNLTDDIVFLCDLITDLTIPNEPGQTSAFVFCWDQFEDTSGYAFVHSLTQCTYPRVNEQLHCMFTPIQCAHTETQAPQRRQLMQTLTRISGQKMYIFPHKIMGLLFF